MLRRMTLGALDGFIRTQKYFNKSLHLSTQVLFALVLMGASGVSTAITVSGTLSLPVPAPFGGVTVAVEVWDDSGNNIQDSSQVLNFAQNDVSKAFSFTASDAANASWHIEAACLDGCATYMNNTYYSEDQLDKTTVDWNQVTFFPGANDLTGKNFLLYGAIIISGQIDYPENAPAAGMVIGVNVFDKNRPMPDGWYEFVGSYPIDVPAFAPFVLYDAKVTNDGTADLLVQVSCWEGDNPQNQCYDFVDPYYAQGGSVANPDAADTLIGGSSYTGINIGMLGAYHVAGLLSLPNGATPVDMDISMHVREENSNGNSDGYEYMTIPAGSASIPYDMKVLKGAPAANWIVRADCENNCGNLENRSYYHATQGQTAIVEQATRIVNTQSHTSIDFSMIEKFSGTPPMCNVLLDDFSNAALDLDDWNTPEASVQLGGGKLSISQKIISRSSLSTATSGKRYGVNLVTLPDSFAAKVILTEADLTDTLTGSAFASLRGGYYYTLDNMTAPDGLLGLIWAGVYVGDRGNGIEAWWEIIESTNSNFSNYTTHSEGTLIVPGTLALNAEYPVSIDYVEATQQFTFSVNGVSAVSVGPTPGVQSGSEYWRRLTAGAVPDDNADNDPVSASATFDDVFADGVLYDNFNAVALDETRWDGPVRKREIVAGKLQAEVLAESSDRQSVRLKTTQRYIEGATCLQGDVAISSSSIIPMGTRGRNRVDGYWYNALHDASSYDGYDGMVWAHISFEQTEDGTLRAAAYAEQATDATYDSYEQLTFHKFTTPVDFDTDYTMAIELDEQNMQLLFRFEDEVWVMPILTDIYPVESALSYKGFTVRTQNGSGELRASIDNVRVSPAFADIITDFSVDENAPDTLIDLKPVLNKANTTYSILSNSNSSLLSTGVNGAELTLQYSANQGGSADIVVRAVSGSRIVDEPFTVTVSQTDSPPTVVNPVSDVNVDEDAADEVLDLSAVFEDVDSSPIVISVVSNTNAAVVSESLSGTNLTLTFQTDQNGMSDITIRATAGGQSVDETFNVTVAAVDDAPTVANPIAEVIVDEDSLDTVIDLIPVFTDVDSGPLTLSIFSNSNSNLLNADISGSNLTLDYLANEQGTAVITVRASADGQHVDHEFNVTVNAVDDPPTTADILVDVAVNEDAADSVIDIIAAFDDIDSPLVFSVTSNSNNGLLNASLAGSDLTLAYLQDKNGDADITVRATGDGQWVEQTFNVAVAAVNDPPVFTSADILGFVNGQKDIDPVTAADVDGDSVSFLVTGGNDAATVDLLATGELSFLLIPDRDNPIDSNLDNEYEITVQAFDGLVTVERDITIVEKSDGICFPIATSGGKVAMVCM